MLSSVALGQRIACGLHPRQAGDLAIPVEGCLQRVERRQRGVDDLLADPVAGNQGGGDARIGNNLCHGGSPWFGTVIRRHVFLS